MQWHARSLDADIFPISWVGELTVLENIALQGTSPPPLIEAGAAA